jgi:gliding motility-associated-like protein
MKFIFLALFTVLSISLLAGDLLETKETDAKKWLNNYELQFVENKGQFTDSEGKPATEVLFKASSGNLDIYITTKGLSYVFIKQEEPPEEKTTSRYQDNMPDKRKKENRNAFLYRLDMNLQGAVIDKEQIIKELPGKQGFTNYFYPNCPEGIYGVRDYGKITIKNIYKGIDWVIYTNSGSNGQPLKYDFVVQPQADYKDIKMMFVNAQSTTLTDNDTKLKIKTIAGTIEEGGLYSYLKSSAGKQAVTTRYTIDKNNLVQFEVGEYDKTKPLVIDPLVWATYYGQMNSLDCFESMCVDNQDNVYITGYSASPGYPTKQLSGAFWQPTNAGNFDCIIIKFNDRGVRQWATYYGGSWDDCTGDQGVNSICSDSQNNIYIAGTTASQDFPLQQLTGAYYQSTNVDHSSAFILKFDNKGKRLWATYYGGNNTEYVNSIRADNYDNIYVTGTTQSTDFPIQQLPGAYWQPDIRGNREDVFILKLNNKCERLWATYYGGNESETIPSICIDSQDNIYLTGLTTSYNFPVQQLPGAYNQDNYAGGPCDMFIIKMNKQGIRQWATYYGGTDNEWVYSICSDKQDVIYITGCTTSIDFPVQNLTGAYNQTNNNGNGDMFLIKIDQQCFREWATYYGGSDLDIGRSISADSKNNIYISGQTYSTNFPTHQLIGEYWQPSNAGVEDAIILKFNTNGIRKWATYYGGTSYDRLNSSVVDSQNSIYFISSELGNNLLLVNYGNGAYFDNSSFSNGILKFVPCNNQKTTSIQSSRENICIYDNGTVTLTAQGGAGDTLKWYTGGCGINYIGKNTVLTIPSPAQTTTYYARWESSCDTSACDSIVINTYTEIDTYLNPVICQGETHTVGDSHYSLTGTYRDIFPTPSGCDSIVISNLVVNPVQSTAKQIILCQGEAYSVGIHQYSATGIYLDTLQTILNCDSIIMTDLTVNPTEQINLSPVICEGEAFTVGNNTYKTPGFYSDKLKTVWGCDSTVMTNLIITPKILTELDPAICSGETFQVGLHKYTLEGTYIDTLKTVLSCDSIITTRLKINPVEKTVQNAEICDGGAFVVGTHAYTTPGVYSDLLKTIFGCDSIVNTNLKVNPINRTSQVASICEGEVFSVGTNDYTTAGLFTAVLKTFAGCDSIVTTNLTVNPTPVFSLGDDLILCPGDSIILSPGLGFNKYVWSDGSFLNNLEVTQPGNYSVTIFNDWCSATDEVTISECSTELWFPNAFSPNYDGKNETFKPVIRGTLNSYQVTVFNKWGQQVYTSNDASTGWNGTFEGNQCPVDLYVYIANYTVGPQSSVSKPRVQRGTVTILR